MRNADRGTRSRHFRTAFAALAATFVAVIAIAPAVLAADSTTLVLRTAPEGKVLELGDIAAAGNVGVVWQEGNHSYMRWSANGGATFAPKVALAGALRATDPRLAACGDDLWAASVWRSADPAVIGIDHRDVSLGTAGAASFALGEGFNPDVACLGDLVAVTWLDSEGRARLVIIGGSCADPCEPAYEADLGPAPDSGRVSVAATDRGFVAAWKASAIAVQRIVVDDTGGTLNVELRPRVDLLDGDAFSPVVAADGSRVVIAYSRFGQTHMKISENRGKTFGARVVVSKFCKNCPEGGSGPNSVDARSGAILVEVGSAFGTPTAVSETGFLTTNGGQTWAKTPQHTGGSQMGVLRGTKIAEAWDRHVYADPIYGDVPQKLRFHTLSMP